MTNKTVESLQKKAASGYKKVVNTLDDKATPILLAGLLVAPQMTAFAANEGNKAITLVINLVAIGLMIRGVLGLAHGLSAYGEAKEDGEGPAMSKAKQQLTGGILMVALGGIFISSIGKSLIGLVSFDSLKW